MLMTQSNRNRPTTERKILIVDGDLISQRVLKTKLTQMGHQVETTADPQWALKNLQRWQADLVLVDLGPSLKWAKVWLEELKAKLPAGAKIVMVAPLNIPTATAICLEAKLDGFLSKPVHNRDLQRILEGHLPHD